MHELFLAHFYSKIWLSAQKENTETLLQFNSLFEGLTQLIRRTMEEQELLDFKDFLGVWRENTE